MFGLKGYDLPGKHDGDDISFLKWVKHPGITDFPEFSICMRCLSSSYRIYDDLRFTKILTNLSPRFNPSRVDLIVEMMLVAVMNGKGNGNKDEVDLKHWHNGSMG